MPQNSLVKLVATAVAVVGFGSASYAQDFPSQSVTMIVPFPPGGSSDQAARPLAEALERIWGQTVVVQNRPGAGAGIGMAETAAATPDGYTIVLTNPAYTVLPVTDALFDREPMISPDEFTPLGRVAAEPLLIVARADATWDSWEELVSDARERPNEISYGSSGIYGAAHIPLEMLSDAADMELNHVPYTGGGPAITGMLSGDVDLTASAPPVLASQVEAGEMKAMVQTGAERIDLMPDVPTAIELGYEVEYYLWAGLFTASDVPEEAVNALRDGIRQAVEDPDYQKSMEDLGLQIQYLDGDDFADFLDEDAARITEAVQAIGRIEE